jgi:formylglycine-generating enzyme required for sulfatase activity
MISLGVGTAVIIFAAVAVWWYVSGGNRSKQPAPPPKVEAPPGEPSKPPPPAEPSAPAGMLRVAGGTVAIGRDGGDPLEQPAHTAQVAPFYIDRTEVTNAEYKKFIDATGHPAPVQWTGGQYPAGEDRLPIVGVTWQDASDYAEWAGKRLPNEEEWEAAARGTDARIYPWGNQWKLGAANIGLKPGRIEEVGKYPDGASPSGAMDMIGNVWEWTADEASVYAGSKAKLVTKPMVTYRVIRGGAYDGDNRHDASYRGYLDASKPYPRVGFRCAKDAK